MRRRHAIVAGAVLSALTVLAAVHCSDDDDGASGPTSPSAAELIGSWEATNLQHSYADSARYSFADTADNYILDVTASTVYTYSKATSVCFCPETSSYQIQGNHLTGPDFSADSAIPDGRITGSTAWSISQGQLTLVSTVTYEQDTSAAALSASGSYTETTRQVFEPYTGQWPLTECAVGCDVFLGIDKQVAAVAGIQGRWVRVSASGAAVETSRFSITPDDNTFFAVFTDDSSYIYELDADNDCYSVDASDYTLSGSSLTGDDYHFTYDASGEWASLRTTVVNEGAGIRLTASGGEGETYQDANGREEYSYTYSMSYAAVRTTSTVPPSWWPTTTCIQNIVPIKAPAKRAPSASLAELKARGVAVLGKRSVFAK